MITSCVRRVTIINFEIALGFTTVCFIHGYLSTTFTVSFFLLVIRAFNKAVRNLISLTCLILPRIIQRTRDAIITSLLCQHDVATSFWRNNDVISTLGLRQLVEIANILYRVHCDCDFPDGVKLYRFFRSHYLTSQHPSAGTHGVIITSL